MPLIDEKHGDGEVLREGEKESALYEARCKRCGACCGAKGADPCSNLKMDTDGRYYCGVYDKRYGTQFTVSGKSFTCVPMRQVLEYRAPYENCGYVEALPPPANNGSDNSMQKSLLWISGIIAAIFAVIITEGSLIVTTKAFGVIKATILRVAFTIPASWIVIYLATKTKKSERFRSWIAGKEAHLSKRAKVAVNGGKAVVLFNTSIFLGPVIASILMLMIGIEKHRIYAYSVLAALLSALSWCAFYGGMLCGIEKLFY